MNLKPSENTKIYGMENFFNELVRLYKQKKIPSKILLSGKKGLGKSTLAYHLINYILLGIFFCLYSPTNSLKKFSIP